MKHIIIFGFLFFNMTPILLHSQCDNFKVFHISGRAYIRDGNTTHDLIKNQVLKDEGVMVEKETQLILIGSGGRSIVLKRNGYYTFDDIRQQCLEPESTLLGKYLHFLYKGLSEKTPETNQRIRGAVSRGEEILMELPFDSTAIMDSEVILSWKDFPAHPVYTVKIFNPSKQEVFSKIIEEDTSYTWVPDPSSISFTGYYTWVVSPEERIPPNSYEYAFRFADEDWEKGFSQELQDLQQELTFDPTTNAMILGSFYESKYLFYEAQQVYQDALTENPTNIDLQDLYRKLQQKIHPTDETDSTPMK